MSDIVVTWPKSRPLGSYMAELERAKAQGLVVCYRVRSLPPFSLGAFDYGAPEVRCYRVHDGRVKGHLKLVMAEFRGAGEVERLPAPGDERHEGCHRRGGVCDCHGRPCAVEYWPPGNYLVCDPEWYEIPRERQPVMAGFRGWRRFDRAVVPA